MTTLSEDRIENGKVEEVNTGKNYNNVFKNILSRLPIPISFSSKSKLFAVMVENHEDARKYQLGLEDAILIQEFFVEGFISRFAALFSESNIPEAIGPVRSIRPYFLDSFYPWSSVIFHAGGSPEALDRVEDFDDFQNFNAIYLEDDYFIRASSVYAPHNLYIEEEGLSSLLSEVDENNKKTISIPLFPVGRAGSGSGALKIYFNFYNPIHNVAYVYDDARNRYDRTNGDISSSAHPENVIFLEMDTEETSFEGRLSIKTVGEGNMLVFRSGKVYEGIWRRESASDVFEFLDGSGEIIPLAKGQVWMTGVDSLNRIEWE